MAAPVISSRQRLFLTVLGGVSLFLTTAIIYAVETSFNPFFYLVGGSRRLASITTYFYLLAVLAYWSALLRVLLEDSVQIPVAIGAFLATGAVVAAGARFSGDAMDEFFLFIVGRSAWWLVLGFGVASLRPGLRLLSSQPSKPWKNWILVGGLAFGAGLVIYALGGRAYSPALMLAKVVLILLVPILALLGIAIRFERGWVLRVLAALAALAGVAEAAIH